MEDVLDVYKRPYDPLYPQVCFDECSKQLVSETRQPLPLEPGHPLRYDYEYERQGVSNFVFVLRTVARMATGGGHRAAHRGRLRPANEVSRR